MKTRYLALIMSLLVLAPVGFASLSASYSVAGTSPAIATLDFTDAGTFLWNDGGPITDTDDIYLMNITAIGADFDAADQLRVHIVLLNAAELAETMYSLQIEVTATANNTAPSAATVKDWITLESPEIWLSLPAVYSTSDNYIDINSNQVNYYLKDGGDPAQPNLYVEVEASAGPVT